MSKIKENLAKALEARTAIEAEFGLWAGAIEPNIEDMTECQWHCDREDLSFRQEGEVYGGCVYGTSVWTNAEKSHTLIVFNTMSGHGNSAAVFRNDLMVDEEELDY